jgi:hypothetical protein
MSFNIFNYLSGGSLFPGKLPLSKASAKWLIENSMVHLSFFFSLLATFFHGFCWFFLRTLSTILTFAHDSLLLI